MVIERRKIETKRGKTDLVLSDHRFAKGSAGHQSGAFYPIVFLPPLFVADCLYLYARMISAPILEIKQMTKRMKALGSDSQSSYSHSQDEIRRLKQQINDLYHHLLEVIDNLGSRNRKI